MWVAGGVSGTPRHEINVFFHFAPDLSSPGLTLVPTGIIKPRNLLKKLSKHERRQTNDYRMRFIVNFNQRIAMWQFGIILPLILPIPLEAETTEIKMGNAFNLYSIWVSNTHSCTHTHLAIKSKCNVTEFTGNDTLLLESVNIGPLLIWARAFMGKKCQNYKRYTWGMTITWLFHFIQAKIAYMQQNQPETA